MYRNFIIWSWKYEKTPSKVAQWAENTKSTRLYSLFDAFVVQKLVQLAGIGAMVDSSGKWTLDSFETL